MILIDSKQMFLLWIARQLRVYNIALNIKYTVTLAHVWIFHSVNATYNYTVALAHVWILHRIDTIYCNRKMNRNCIFYAGAKCLAGHRNNIHLHSPAQVWQTDYVNDLLQGAAGTVVDIK